MAVQRRKGFSFAFNGEACNSCSGRCCTGASGHIWITPQDAEGMSRTLGVSFAQFISEYTHRINGRLSLNEHRRSEVDYACIMYENGCKVYQHRPTQCRTFPFWDHFRRNPEEVQRECPGIVEDLSINGG